MSNENLPLEGGSLIDAIREFNLPNLIAGPAGKAISRLIAGAADIPAAFLEGISQGIRDKKEAKTLISKELAKAVAENAKLDIETVNRAAVRWLGDEVRKQVNREEVARKTIDYLKDSPVEESTPVVDDDFMDSFSSYAEKANSEKMRDLWARVLKGEIRKPGSYSLATLRFMAELDIETANAVQEIFIGVFRGGAIFWQEDFNKSPKLTSVTLLEQRGLLSGVGGMRSTYPEIESNGYLILPFRKKGLERVLN